MNSSELLKEFHSKLSPQQFEDFLSILLGEMGFSDVEITGRSGDRGIDLKATWTETNVPGFEVDLDFKIQAKRLNVVWKWSVLGVALTDISLGFSGLHVPHNVV